MSLKSTTLLIIFCTLSQLSLAQPDCAVRSFPAVLPLRLNESMAINLEDYFEGSNLTYAVSPNDGFSSLSETYQCQSIGEQNVGRVIASRLYTQLNAQISVILAESTLTPGAHFLHLIQLQHPIATTLALPTNSINNCTHFDLQFLNSTHFRPTVDCRYTSKFYTKVLLTGVGQWESSFIEWKMILAPLFSYLQILDTRIELVGDSLVRGILSPAGSYVEIWSWNDDARELVGLIDKTFFGLDVLYIKALQLHGNLLIILDYNTGLHLMRVTPTRRFVSIGSLPEPFYQNFEYNPSSGVLYLGKKGKIVSTTVRLQGSSMSIGESYNVYKYQNIRKILASNRNLVILGETMINLFRIAPNNPDSRHYQLYESKGAVDLFPLTLPGVPLTFLLVRNQGSLLSIQKCEVETPYLRLSAPGGQHTVSVIAKSQLQGKSSVCSQQFIIQRMTTELDFIFDNGFRTDSEVLFANLPGEGLIELSKYGLGRNLNYKVISNSSKIEYETSVRKGMGIACQMDDKFISNGGKIYLTKTWGRLLLVQFSADYILRYYYCDPTPFPSCWTGKDDLKLGPINHIAHQNLEVAVNSSVVLEAIVQEEGDNVIVLIRRVTLLEDTKFISVDSHCNITIENFTEFGGNVTQVEITGGRLFVLLSLRKQIRIYDLLQIEECPLISTLNSETINWGYFSPRRLHFDKSGSTLHFQTLYIQQWDEFLTVRLQGAGVIRPVLLSRNMLPLVVNMSIVVSHPYFILFSRTNNTADTYFIDDSHMISKLRPIPLMGRTFKPIVEGGTDFYDLLDSSHIALSLWDPKKAQAMVSVFKFDELISATQQYYSIPLLNSQSAVFITGREVSSRFVLRLELISSAMTSYLLCRANSTYLTPSLLLHFKQTRVFLEQYSENVTLVISSSNDIKIHTFKISLSNVGNTIKRGNRFPPRGQSVEAMTDFTIDDSRWFSGSIFEETFDCIDCGSRIKFSKKIRVDSREQLDVPHEQFWLEEDAEMVKILVGGWVIGLMYNYTADPDDIDNLTVRGYGLTHSMSLAPGGNCHAALPFPRLHLTVGLCWRLTRSEQKQYFLALTSTASYRGFSIQQRIVALNQDDISKVRLIVKDELIVVYSPKAALVLTLWEIEQRLQFVELDQIDQEDISNSICYAEIVTNSTTVGTPITSLLYSLIITQCTSTIYYTTFSIYLEKQQYVDQSGKIATFSIPNIHVSNAQNINLIKLLAQKHIQIPAEANIIQTMAFNETDPLPNEYLYSLIAVFDRFHTYRFLMRVDSTNGIILSLNLQSIYYKFGAYQAVSAHMGDYLVVKYVLDGGRLDQMYGGFYPDAFVYNSDGIQQHHLFATYSLRKFGVRGQPETPWQLQGKRIIQLNNQYLERLNVSHLIQAHITGLANTFDDPYQVLYSQNIIITANNPNSARSASITLHSTDKIILTTLQIVMIVLGSIFLIILITFMGRYAYRKYDAKRKMVPLLENLMAEDVDLQSQEQQRAEWRINASDRGSVPV